MQRLHGAARLGFVGQGFARFGKVRQRADCSASGTAMILNRQSDYKTVSVVRQAAFTLFERKIFKSSSIGRRLFGLEGCLLGVGKNEKLNSCLFQFVPTDSPKELMLPVVVFVFAKGRIVLLNVLE